MKILLINNHTEHLEELTKALSGHDVEIQTYKPGLVFKDKGKDLVILSGGGGEGIEIHDVYRKGKLWYHDQMEFVRKTNKPILGICMGFEVVANAYGAKIRQMPKLVQGQKTISVNHQGQKLLGKKRLKQYESHNWHVAGVSKKHFKVLAESPTGIEMIKHRTKPILATQFHPEVPGGSLQLDSLMKIAF